MKPVRLTWMLLLFVSLLSCAKVFSPDAPSSYQVMFGYGTSFGECIGYCKTELSINDGLARLVVSSWQPKELPEKSTSERLPDDEWNALLQNVNWEDFKQQPEVIGCPDCADGGAEWVKLQIGNDEKKVTFEFGKTLDGQENLLQQLRAIHERMRQNI